MSQQRSVECIHFYCRTWLTYRELHSCHFLSKASDLCRSYLFCMQPIPVEKKPTMIYVVRRIQDMTVAFFILKRLICIESK